MLRIVTIRNLGNVPALVKAPSIKSNRKRFQTGRSCLGGVMKNSRRIDAAAHPNSDRNVRDQMFADRFLQQIIQLFFRLLQAAASNLDRKSTRLNSSHTATSRMP